MPFYRLEDEQSEIIDHADAQNEAHALAIFGHKLGKNLTFACPAAPDFLLRRIDDGIPVTEHIDVCIGA